MSETYDDSGGIEYAPTIGGKQCFYCDCLPAGMDGRPARCSLKPKAERTRAKAEGRDV